MHNMRNRIIAVVAVSGALSTLARASDYVIDPKHSEVSFSVSNLGVHTVRGKFDGFKGTIHYDPTQITASQIQTTIDAVSIDTENKDRDHHLRSKDFFDVAAYPEITFMSDGIQPSSGAYQMHGRLTIKGNTRPVVLAVHLRETAPNSTTGLLMATAEGEVDRRDFGLNYGNAFAVGHRVRIHLQVEAHPTEPITPKVQ